ncbi:YMGG-like glycine zipper-containing protein [Azospirillum soli]|uniref:YMGG-like glycine zipper-containing protein n=1 Tax=Azospirillum soli TaxID=1304799 RepID=UPI001AE57060|nr:YMGG-like glycine zipper-containing protein [Azospirillum soli]MBP2313594.1 putative membrane protein [Azospirillum soli]
MLKKITVILFGALVLAGCSNLNHREQRTLSGGAIGAAGGAAIGALTGGSAVMGGVIGGAAGAAVGALTSDSGKRR